MQSTSKLDDRIKEATFTLTEASEDAYTTDIGTIAEVTSVSSLSELLLQNSIRNDGLIDWTTTDTNDGVNQVPTTVSEAIEHTSDNEIHTTPEVTTVLSPAELLLQNAFRNDAWLVETTAEIGTVTNSKDNENMFTTTELIESTTANVNYSTPFDDTEASLIDSTSSVSTDNFSFGAIAITTENPSSQPKIIEILDESTDPSTTEIAETVTHQEIAPQTELPHISDPIASRFSAADMNKPAVISTRRSDIPIEEEHYDDYDNDEYKESTYLTQLPQRTSARSLDGNQNGNILSIHHMRRLIPLIVQQVRSGNMKSNEVEAMRKMFIDQWKDIGDRGRQRKRRYKLE